MAQYAKPMFNTFNPDTNSMKYVGWQDNQPWLQKYYSQTSLRTISKKVTELLNGVEPNGRPIIVTDEVIGNVMNDVYNYYVPAVGDIYSRYNIPNGPNPENYAQSMIDQTIELIVNYVKNQYEMSENNRKLTVWTTVLGDFNAQGLRAHPEIKIRKRRPDPMQFHMNY